MKDKFIIILLLQVMQTSFSLAQFIFQKTYGGINDDVGESIQETSDSGYVICGYSYSYATGSINSDVYLIKTDGEGDTN
jgi:hypothetical protein